MHSKCLPREACSRLRNKVLRRTDHVGTSCYAINLKCNWNSESQQWNQEQHQSRCLHKSILTSPDELIQHAPWLQTSRTTSSISNIKSILRATFPRVITKGQSKFQTPLETCKDWVTRPDRLFLYISVDMFGRRMGMQHNDCLALPAPHPNPRIEREGREH